MRVVIFTEEVDELDTTINGKSPAETLAKMQFALLGDYLAYRRVTDRKILIRKIDVEGKQTEPPEFTLDLSNIFSRENDKYSACFFSVP